MAFVFLTIFLREEITDSESCRGIVSLFLSDASITFCYPSM